MLDVFVFGRRLDDEITIAEGFKTRRIRNTFQRLGLVRLLDQPLADLAVQILGNRRNALFVGLFLQIVEADLVAGESDDVGDALSHLPRTDDADRTDGSRRLQRRGLGFVTGFQCLRHGLEGPLCGVGVAQLPAFFNSASSSGSAWKRSATSP